MPSALHRGCRAEITAAVLHGVVVGRAVTALVATAATACTDLGKRQGDEQIVDSLKAQEPTMYEAYLALILATQYHCPAPSPRRRRSWSRHSSGFLRAPDCGLLRRSRCRRLTDAPLRGIVGDTVTPIIPCVSGGSSNELEILADTGPALTEGAPIRTRTGPSLLAITALCAAGLAVASFLWQAWHAAPIDVNHHCGYDGLSWCRMSTWHAGYRPYERRFLTAVLVFLTRPTMADAWVRFLVVDVLATVGLLAGVAVLTRRLAIHLGATRQRARWGAVLAASSLAFAFYPWHYTLMVPVNTDVLSAALGLGWILLITAPDERLVFVGVPVAFLTQAARDTWGPALLLCCVVLFVLDRRRRTVALASAVAVVAAAGVSVLVHAAPSSTTPLLQVYGSQLADNFGSVHGFAVFAWNVAFGLGAISLFALPTFKAALRDSQLALPWALAIGSAAVALVAGGGTDRYLLPTLMMFLCLGMGWVAARRAPAADVAVIPVLALSIGLWRPWQTLSGAVGPILRIYNPYIEPWPVNRSLFVQHLTTAGLAVAAGVVVAGAVALVHGRLSVTNGEAKT